MLSTDCDRWWSRRRVLKGLGAVIAAGSGWARPTRGDEPAREVVPADGTTIIDFEKKLKAMRFEHYRHPPVDVLTEGFRPVGGSVADFCTAHLDGRDHFFYIERRLQEGTPFFPGHEIYFGHASTANLLDWEVHDPVLLVRPGTWEEGHVWAPFILPVGGEFVMCYTGLNRHLSQDLGLASSTDLFKWRRWGSNPISPCRAAPWAAWWEEDICSCRDPHMLHHEGRVYLAYTANTRAGASCLALASSADLRGWRDHGPILTGASSGYEPRLWGGHTQGSLESCNLSFRAGRWRLIFNGSLGAAGCGNWIVESDRIDAFSMDGLRKFSDSACVEAVRDDGGRSLLAGLAGGRIRFLEVDWSAARPEGRWIGDRDALAAWRQRGRPAVGL